MIELLEIQFSTSIFLNQNILNIWNGNFNQGIMSRELFQVSNNIFEISYTYIIQTQMMYIHTFLNEFYLIN